MSDKIGVKAQLCSSLAVGLGKVMESCHISGSLSAKQDQSVSQVALRIHSDTVCVRSWAPMTLSLHQPRPLFYSKAVLLERDVHLRVLKTAKPSFKWASRTFQ